MTETRSGKIVEPRPQASKRDVAAKAAKVVQKSTHGANIATGHAERSNNAKTAAMADAALACDAGNTTEDSNLVPSATEGPAPNNPAPTNSTTNAASACETNRIAEQDKPPMPSTQPDSNSVAPPFTSTVVIVNSPTIATNNSAPAPSTSTAAIDDVASPSRASNNAIEQMPTITNDLSEMNTSNTAGPQSSPDHTGEKAQTLARTAGNSQQVAALETGKPKRRSGRRVRKIGVKPLITEPNRPDDPVIVADRYDGSDDISIPRSIKQVLRNRQLHVERIKPSLDNLIAYIDSTADSDRSSDYDSVRVGEKRSFKDFVAAELDDSDQSRVFAGDLMFKIRDYQAMLLRTKAFQHQRL